MPNIQYTASRKQVNGFAEIRARFYSGTINQRAATGIFVPVSQWNEQEGRCTINRRYETPTNQKARSAQQQLDCLTDFIYNRYTREALNISPSWLRTIIAEYHHPQAQDPPLYEQIEPYCAARNIAAGTRRKIRVLGNYLRRFAENGYTLRASTITRKDLDRFAAFLMYRNGEQVQSRNSVNGRLRQLRTLVYWVGKPHPNPFDGYNIPADVYGTPIYLTREERDYLYMLKDFSPKKQIQRDIFIFQCHTGCRVSDLYNLRPANIKDGWLVYVQQKTARANPQTIEVPLSPTALEIVERYKGTDKQGRLFPFISMPKYGKAITMICKQADLSRPVITLNPRTYESQAVPLWSVVSSHTARKTFTQILYSSTGDKRLVASLTGHSENSRAFSRYSEIDRSMKAAAVLGGNLATKTDKNT